MNCSFVKFCVLGLALAAALFVLAPASSAQDKDWKGFYLGGNVGGAFGSSDATTTTVFSATGYFATTSPAAIATAGTQSIKPRGFSGGGGVGYNHQSGHLVVGAEFDFGGMNLNNSVSTTALYPCCAPTAFTVTQTMKTSWLMTARPRFGYAAGGLLIYGTAGLAVTNLDYQATFTDTFATAAENGGVTKKQTGFAAGAGLEHKIGSKLSFKGEYLYARFGTVSATSTNLMAFNPALAFPTNVFTHTANLNANIIRGGINYRF
ncbi:MAG: outer membrane beta-barrel protein [Acidobacteriia bacterium]|nr:outer membrane beta-barrel protein [Terriglobia bacterium]